MKTLVLALLLVSSLASACGGEEAAPRPATSAEREVEEGPVTFDFRVVSRGDPAPKAGDLVDTGEFIALGAIQDKGLDPHDGPGLNRDRTILERVLAGRNGVLVLRLLQSGKANARWWDWHVVYGLGDYAGVEAEGRGEGVRRARADDGDARGRGYACRVASPAHAGDLDSRSPLPASVRARQLRASERQPPAVHSGL